MPKALKKTAERQRKERFSNEELLMLTTTLAANAEVVFVNDMRREALLKKKAIWAEVAQKVSAVGTTTRSVNDCRKRWDDLRVGVRNILTVNRNMAIGTGGGAESPLKLKEWEEICASTIGVKSIEGVGDMEQGVPITYDGGSHTDTEEARTSTPAPAPRKKARRDATGDTTTSSRGPGRSDLVQREKGNRSSSSTQPEAMPAAVVAPTGVCLPASEGSIGEVHSAATSSKGEAAATAPGSDAEVEPAIEDLSQSPIPTRTSLSSPMLSPGPFSQGGTPTHPHDVSWGTQVSTPDDSAMDPGASAMPPAADMQHGLSAVIQRQTEITALVGQHVAETERLREDIGAFAQQTRECMEACTSRICTEIGLLRKAMNRIADAIERRCPLPTTDEQGPPPQGVHVTLAPYASPCAT
ncbi:myb-related transcription factor, partner of profilin-like [Ambystoma mexicanum]|uniref:myb-related transcription factor, partner of profilin-like n=1 Tax=Ambystoma mexicanum TaxID=8296 RepID=UPI0037E8556C